MHKVFGSFATLLGRTFGFVHAFSYRIRDL
jgi:hypothetical protein